MNKQFGGRLRTGLCVEREGGERSVRSRTNKQSDEMFGRGRFISRGGGGEQLSIVGQTSNVVVGPEQVYK